MPAVDPRKRHGTDSVADLKPELEAASIVLRGSFNPSILHPSWLAVQGLVPSAEAEKALEEKKEFVVSRELTTFAFDWFSIQVTADRFGAYSSDPSRFPGLRDLVVGVFKLLDSTPVGSLGMNRSMHFKVTEDHWHTLGDTWAPKEPWKDALRGNRPGNLPGLRSLTMEGNREGSESGRIRVKVEPSVRITPGIFIDTNEHHEPEGDGTLETLRNSLTEDWEDAQRFFHQIAAHLLKK